MRVNPRALTDYPLFIRAFFRKQKFSYGEVLKPGMLWGRSPWVFATLALLYGALNRKSSPLDPALRSLVTVRVSQINHCAFCIDINSSTLIKRGASVKKVMDLQNWRGSEFFSESERVALEYTEAVTITDRDVEDELFARLKKYFDDDSIIELTGMISFQNMSSKFNSALDVPPQGFCQLPPSQDKEFAGKE